MDTKNIEAVTREFVREMFRLFPSQATSMGVHAHDHLLESFSREARQETLDSLKKLSRLRGRINPGKLSPAEQTDYALMGTELFLVESHIEEIRTWERDPAAYAELILQSAYFLIGRENPPKGTWNALLSRMKQFPRLLDEARQNLKNPPPLFCTSAIEVTLGGIEFFKSLKLDRIAASAKLKRELEKELRITMQSLDDYAGWIRRELLPRARGRVAVGRNTFDRLLKHLYLLPYDARDLKEIGTDRFRSTLREMKALAKRINPHKSWEDLLSESAHNHPSSEKLIAAYAREMKKTRAFLKEKNLVPFPRHDTVTVGETPPFYRSFLPFAAYMPPPLFQKKGEGKFWVTPIPPNLPKNETRARLKEHAFHKIPVIVLHETYPGHHVQLSFLQEVSSPLVKRAFASAEGWALYCEEMMREQGYYSNPLSELSQRKDELWRIVRVLLDVGLHAEGMKPERAVEYLSRSVQMPESMAWGEVKRYAREATQPMSYFVGKMEILKLRDAYRKKLKEKFKLLDFHREMLRRGPVPVKLAEKELMAGA